MKEERDGRRVLKFWKNVLKQCKEGGGLVGWRIGKVLALLLGI